MQADSADLSSTATALEELTARISTIAERHRGDDRSDLTAELDEVERALRAATRRLSRLVDRLT